MQWIYPIYSLLLVLNIVIISEEDAVTLPETAKLRMDFAAVKELLPGISARYIYCGTPEVPWCFQLLPELWK